MTAKKKLAILGWTFIPFSSFFFTGYISYKGKGGGTSTSIATTLILIFCRYYDVPISIATILLLTLVVAIIGLCVIGRAEQFIKVSGGSQLRYNSEGKNVEGDFGQTTIDEAFGILLTTMPIYIIETIMITVLNKQFTLEYFIALQIFALIMFRIYDTIKVGMVKKIDTQWKKESSISIMCDDAAAAWYAVRYVSVAALAIPLFSPQSIITC